MKLSTLFYILIAAVIAGPVLFMVLTYSSNQPEQVERFIYDEGSITFETAAGEAAFRAAFADAPREKRKGLSGQPDIAHDEALVFVYRSESTPHFWMKDMNFPIDIVWIGEDLRVVDIHHRVSPDSYRSEEDAERFSPSAPAQFVVEMCAGCAKEGEIKIGDKATIERE